MKVAIGYNPVTGPWGGGNGFFEGLQEYLRAAGVSVVNNLRDEDIDIILIADPRNLKTTAFSPNQVWRYQRKYPQALSVHRINECDERKNTKHMNAKLRRCNEVADFTVFVGSWLSSLQVWRPDLNYGSKTILNGSDERIFNSDNFTPWSGQGKVKLVTHHWGGNWMKGFDIYEKIDHLLTQSKWQSRIEFTYIGNLPKNFQFKQATYLHPKDKFGISQILKQNHAYVTGSINEPGGNHQNEAAQCGLPVICLKSGCMPEYLDGYAKFYAGVHDFESRLEEFLLEYDHWAKKIVSYPNSLTATCQHYESLFRDLIQKRGEIMACRVSKNKQKSLGRYLWF